MKTGETIFIVIAVLLILAVVVLLPMLNGLGSYKAVKKDTHKRHKKRRSDADIVEENEPYGYVPPTTSQMQSRDDSSRDPTSLRKRVNDSLNDKFEAPITFRPKVNKPARHHHSGSGIARHVDKDFDLDEFWQKEAENDVKDQEEERVRLQKEQDQRQDFTNNDMQV